MAKLKILTACVLMIILASMPLISGAASATSLPAYYSGTVDYLIDIRNPETIVSTTTNRNCVFISRFILYIFKLLLSIDILSITVYIK